MDKESNANWTASQQPLRRLEFCRSATRSLAGKIGATYDWAKDKNPALRLAATAVEIVAAPAAQFVSNTASNLLSVADRKVDAAIQRLLRWGLGGVGKAVKTVAEEGALTSAKKAAIAAEPAVTAALTWVARRSAGAYILRAILLPLLLVYARLYNGAVKFLRSRGFAAAGAVPLVPTQTLALVLEYQIEFSSDPPQRERQRERPRDKGHAASASGLFRRQRQLLRAVSDALLKRGVPDPVLL